MFIGKDEFVDVFLFAVLPFLGSINQDMYMGYDFMIFMHHVDIIYVYVYVILYGYLISFPSFTCFFDFRDKHTVSIETNSTTPLSRS